jgi:polyisoprenoid-binding protein YceI
MKLRYAVLALLLAVASARAEEKKFTIDTVHSGVGFRIRHLVAMFPGRFDVFSGTIVCDTNNVTGMTVRATVDVSSVSTANAARDKHLRTADFFDVEKFPTATFESTKVTAGADGALTIRGKLVLRGIEAEVVFDGKVLGFGPDMKGVNRVGYHGKGTIDRTKFGIVYNASLAGGLNMLGNEVELTLDIEAIEVKELPEGAKGEPKK